MLVRRRSITYAVAATAAVILALTGCSTATGGGGTDTGTTTSSDSSDIADYCGDKPAKVTFLKSVGGNTWVLQAAAEFLDEASKCPNVTASFSQQFGDQQKAIADITSAVAQGTNVIVIQADYGAPQLPALRAATEAGVKVVQIIGTAGGTEGTDYYAAALFDTVAIGQTWADFIHEQLPDGGNVAYIGGTPGNETSTYFFNDFQKGLAKYDNLTILGDGIQYANWDPVENRKVTAGLISKYGQIDAIVSDFNAPNIGVLQAFDDAGVARPIITSITPSNQLACDWLENPYPWLTLGGTSSLPRLALRIGLGAYEGIENKEPRNVLPEPLAYTVDGEQPTCNPDFPPDADLSADLTEAQLTELFQN